MTFYIKAKKLDGTLERIEVTREVYRVYYESRRKEKYLNDPTLFLKVKDQLEINIYVDTKNQSKYVTEVIF